jgi:hypothetical protein
VGLQVQIKDKDNKANGNDDMYFDVDSKQDIDSETFGAGYDYGDYSNDGYADEGGAYHGYD